MSDMFDKLNNIASQNNISPDMVNNLFNMLNNSNSDDKHKNSNNSSDNSCYEQNSNTNSSNCKNNQDTSSDNSGLDFETIMKMKTIIDKINTKDDPRSNLLLSLKPYLNDSRKAKVDQYIKLMNMSKVMEVFPFMGGDKKNDR